MFVIVIIVIMIMIIYENYDYHYYYSNAFCALVGLLNVRRIDAGHYVGCFIFT